MNHKFQFPDNIRSKYWLASAEMGYGHNRAIYPLFDLAKQGKLILMNETPKSSSKEKRSWRRTLMLYELLSRLSRVRIAGKIFSIFLDWLLLIPDFNSGGDQTSPTIQTKVLSHSIRKGLCKGFLETIQGDPGPVISSFYAPAIAADKHNNIKVYCIICDTDLNRVWVPEVPSSSNIIYFATGATSVNRLRSYGVSDNKILLTGFPLPVELVGDRNYSILKHNLAKRLQRLDPDGNFHKLHHYNIDAHLGEGKYEYKYFKNKLDITITYAVGGAGAQKETARKIAESLAPHIRSGNIKLNLVAGTRKDIELYFYELKNKLSIDNNNLSIIWERNFSEYYKRFNECLLTTDVLWTKPSELSFYCALGLPIIISEPIGPQEKCNQKWLTEIGAGINQQDPAYTHQWLPELINKGRLAEIAWNGFLKAGKDGTFNISDYLANNSMSVINTPEN